jgi:streptogramin lyase
MLRIAVAFLVATASAQTANPVPTAAEAQTLRARVAKAPRLPMRQRDLPIQPPQAGWKLGMVSWVAVDSHGVTYVLHRGQDAEPIVALDRDGKVLRSWGRGLFVMPHAIRVDPAGNIWTADAASSKVYKFSPQGNKLLEIVVGGQPPACPENFCSTTDVAFGPNGRIFIADGYSNARILEYTADGRKVREWGQPGVGPGQFQLVHSIAIDERNVIYVADRENGRIQKFNLDGKYAGEIAGTGKTFSLVSRDGALYAAAQPRNLPNLSPGWLFKLDRDNGRILGYVDAVGVHGMEVTPGGDWMFGPGPQTAHPQLYRRQ